MLRLGIVTDNNDPLNLRRIRVQSADRGSSVSDWLSRLSNYTNQDQPVPKIGDTVVIGMIDGDTNRDVVVGVLTSSSTNKPLTKESEQDYQEELADHKSVSIAKQIELISQFGQVEVMADGGIKLSNQLGSIYLLPTGYTIISYPGGSISLGSSGFSINSPLPININAPDLVWNGQRVSRVGGTDSRGDTTLS